MRRRNKAIAASSRMIATMGTSPEVLAASPTLNTAVNANRMVPVKKPNTFHTKREPWNRFRR